MEAKKIIVTFLVTFFLTSGYGQVNSRKEQREKNRIEKQHQIDTLIKSRVFVFVASRALPQGGNTIDLTTNSNFLKFRPDKIESYLPFFGRAYSIDYGGDGGIKFEGKPQEYKVVTKKEGKGFEINVTVSVTRDNYKLLLIVGPDGNAFLTINSNQRSTISYNGNVMKIEERDDNQAEGKKQNK